MGNYNQAAPARQAGGREKRSAPRIPIALPVLVEASGRQHSAKLHNLSRGGALVESAVDADPGTPITFSCGTIETRGTIVWRETNRFGIKVGGLVDDARIAQQVARAEAARQREVARLGRQR